MDAYLPTDRDDHPAVVLVHGGGWTNGSKDWLSGQAGYLAKKGFAAFSIDYRLAPDNPPAALIEDVELAVSWIRSHAGAYQVDPKRIAVFGTSAGGHLAAMVGSLTNANHRTGWGVAAVVSWSGPMDLRAYPGVEEMFVDQGWGNCGTSREQCESALKEASPNSHVSSDDPPILIVNSIHEKVPVATARTMVRRVKRHGVQYVYYELPGSEHATDYTRTVIPGTSVTVLEATTAFLSRQLRSSSG
jgi:acetyl esterase/lipase